MKNSLYKEMWSQFGAAIDMFENAVEKCPDKLWNYNYKTEAEVTDPKDINELRSCFWYVAYHTLFFLDYYLDLKPHSFKMPVAFHQREEDFDEVLPPKFYSKEELLDYIKHCRYKLQVLLSDMDDEKAALRWKTSWRDFSITEMCLYNLRHVQHHTGQLNLMLGKIDHSLPIWVSQTKVLL
jgi:hypothetical protein